MQFNTQTCMLSRLKLLLEYLPSPSETNDGFIAYGEYSGHKGSLVITLYGISNCDTVRKARKWLAAAGIEYRFHDYRKDGLDKASLQTWSNELGWEALLNRRGTTWRQLPEQQKASVDEASAIELMLEQPAIIRRPLLDTGYKRVLGFSDKQYQTLFQ